MEKIYVCCWSKPVEKASLISTMNEEEIIGSTAGLYLIHGYHVLYGNNVPLYLGSTDDLSQRIKDHKP